MNKALKHGLCSLFLGASLFGCGSKDGAEAIYSCKMKSTVTWQDGTVQHPYGKEGYAYEFSLNKSNNLLTIPGAMKGESQSIKGENIGGKIKFRQPSTAKNKVEYIFNTADLTLTASTKGESSPDGSFSIFDKGTCEKK